MHTPAVSTAAAPTSAQRSWSVPSWQRPQTQAHPLRLCWCHAPHPCRAACSARKGAVLVRPAVAAVRGPRSGGWSLVGVMPWWAQHQPASRERQAHLATCLHIADTPRTSLHARSLQLAFVGSHFPDMMNTWLTQLNCQQLQVMLPSAASCHPAHTGPTERPCMRTCSAACCSANVAASAPAATS